MPVSQGNKPCHSIRLWRGQPWAWVMARVRDQIQDQFLVGLGPRLVGVNPKSRPTVGPGPGLPGMGSENSL